MDTKQDVVTIPHAIQYITSPVTLISMASIRQVMISGPSMMVLTVACTSVTGVLGGAPELSIY